MVHLSVTEAPTTSPVTVEFGEPGVVTVAVPLITDHSPAPTTGVLPAKVVVVTLHKFWSRPADAVVGLSMTLITTSSAEDGQEPFVIVHLSVAEEPATSPVTPEVGEEGVVTVAAVSYTHLTLPTKDSG